MRSGNSVAYAIYPFNDLAFLLINFRFESRLCEPQSPFPGNGILPAETKAPERRLRFGMALGRDDARTRKPANSALFATWASMTKGWASSSILSTRCMACGRC